jgi:biopolymer transport protein TolQ
LPGLGNSDRRKTREVTRALTPTIMRGTNAPAMNGSLNYVEMVTHGGPIVTGVLLILVLSSLASWTIIFRKALYLRRAQAESVRFLETFWRSKRLDSIYAASEELALSPVAQVFRAGYVELSKVTQAKGAPGSEDDAAMHDQLGGFENVERALARAANAELTALETQVPFLGTTAAAAPFVGLFGTVWGIMGAFRDIYAAGNANLATVARPISEALIATAMGLFAAIPALVAYNAFSSRIRVLDNEMRNFSADFLNIIKRHIFKKAA